MIKQLKENNKWKEVKFLLLLITCCFTMSVTRVFSSDSLFYIFLNWNLFLAGIPYMLSTYVLINPEMKQKKRFMILVMFAWLMFFPNAPYIFTDLFHIRHVTSMPLWFDTLMILTFAWTGLMLGMMSLNDVEKMLREKIKSKWVSILTCILLFLISFGIYLGRYLRWNSWDVLFSPISIIADITDRIFNPFQHPETWGMTIMMGIFLNIIYWSLKLMKQKFD